MTAEEEIHEERASMEARAVFNSASYGLGPEDIESSAPNTITEEAVSIRGGSGRGGGFCGRIARTESLIGRRDEEMLQTIETRKAEAHTGKSPWPLQRKRKETFANDEKLNKLRRCNSSVIVHVDKLIPKDDSCKSGKKTCAMCSSAAAGRTTRYHCAFCSVALCTSVHAGEGFDTSCSQAWHSAENLTAESKLRTDAFVGKRQETHAHEAMQRAKAADQFSDAAAAAAEDGQV